MKTSELRRVMEIARRRKAINPCLTAIIIAYGPGLSTYGPLEICQMLGVSSSYVSTVRSTLRVTKELEMLGYHVSSGN